MEVSGISITYGPPMLQSGKLLNVDLNVQNIKK